jgi:acetylornithine deacetylase/succinyl-diaminopimelate desuccinylase-like protein
LILSLVAGAGALIAVVLLLAFRLNRETDDRYVPRNVPLTPELELLRQYVRIDTSNPPGNETAGAHFLLDLLARGGIKGELIESAPGRGSVYARIHGRQRGGALLLLSHIDVMPANPREWSHPPFAGETTLDTMWGRGTLDMKGIAITQLEAFLDVARSGRVPDHDIVFLATADEEAGSRMGVRWLLANRPDIFENVAYALTEGGITETFGGNVTYFGVEIASKITLHTRIHASSKETLQRVRIALEPSISSREPLRVLPEVKAFLRDIAPYRFESKELLEDVDRTIASGKFWLLQQGYRELMQNNVWPNSINEQADHTWAMEVRLFNLPDENPEARVAWLRSMVAPFGATVEADDLIGPVPFSRRATPLYRMLEQEVNRQFPHVNVGTEILTVSTTDSRFIRGRGIDCYGIWPFPVDFFQTQGIHHADERVRMDWFGSGVALMRRLVMRYAFDSASGAH